MQRCLHLAKKGINAVAPNPMVGAVITIPDESCPFGQRIIGEGYHMQFGGPHAEINAIQSVKQPELLSSATIYVSLEPCSHFGKTPPCADAIVANGIKKVVVGCHDPNPKVAGAGIKRLRSTGIEVIEDIEKVDCEFLNRRFFTSYKFKRPYIILKWAQSADGFISLTKSEPYFLSNPLSLLLVQQWRSEEQAIMIASNTAISDNPKLTNRDWPGHSPLRLLLDRNGRVPVSSHLYSDDKPLVTFSKYSKDLPSNKTFVGINELLEILEWCYKQSIQSIFVEGGASLHREFISRNLWDEARIFSTPKVLGTGYQAAQLQGHLISTEKVDSDTLYTYLNHNHT